MSYDRDSELGRRIESERTPRQLPTRRSPMGAWAYSDTDFSARAIAKAEAKRKRKAERRKPEAPTEP